MQHKMLGEQELALENYNGALQAYTTAGNKNTASYASTLTNLGVLYKEMSKGRLVDADENDEENKGKQRLEPLSAEQQRDYWEKAERALVEARNMRLQLLGAWTHRCMSCCLL